MKNIFNKRSFQFYLKSLSPFSHSNPNPNLINYNQQIRLIRTITPLISNRRCLNGVNYRMLSTRISEPNINKTILLPGCDLVHWLVVVDQPDLNLTRDDIIDGYIKTLATVVRSEEEARMKIYSVSTKHYFAFGALVSEELAYKLKELPHVRWVLPDSYLDVKNQTYAGEPFINGQAVPYDSKYHAIWLRNREESQKSNMRNKRKQSDRNQCLEPGLRYQSQPSEPPISDRGHNHYKNIPHDMPPNYQPDQSSYRNMLSSNAMVSPHGNWNYQKESLTPSTHVWDSLPSHDANSGFQGRDMPSHNANTSFQGQDMPSHNANLGFQGRYIPSPYANPGFQRQNMSYHIVNQDFQGRDMPSHNANLGFQGQGVPSHKANRSFQGQDMPSLNVNSGFRGQNMTSHSVSPGFPGRDMLSHNSNLGFQGQEVSSHSVNQGFQQQDMTYPRQQSGYRGFSGDAQNDNYHNGYFSTLPKHLQSQDSYADVQSSNTTVPSLGARSSQNANMTPPTPPRDMPSQMQKPGIHRLDDFRSDASPPQQHQSTYTEFQSSNAAGYHPIKNYHDMNASVQNNRFRNANMMPHVQNHNQGANISQPIQNSEYQHDMRQTAKQVDNAHEGSSPGTLQPRDYQERDAPSDD